METIRKLRPDHWAWLHAKAALVVWSVLFFLYIPNKLSNVLGVTIGGLISLITLIGVLISVVGLFASLSKYTVKASRGTSLELSGLWLAISGPIAYLVVQFYLTFGIEGDQRIALVAFSYTLCAFMLVRIVSVFSFRKKTQS